jgi:hypothetical protein
MSLAELQALVIALQDRITVLETPKPKVNGSPREMTEADAYAVITGEHAATKHQDAADKLGLSYGQVYSCRKEFTFKAVHKALKEQGKKNPWMK